MIGYRIKNKNTNLYYRPARENGLRWSKVGKIYVKKPSKSQIFTKEDIVLEILDISIIDEVEF